MNILMKRVHNVLFSNNEESLGLGRLWVECDKCKSSVHSDCISITAPEKQKQKHTSSNFIIYIYTVKVTNQDKLCTINA
jgi:hypothetical protein